MSSGLRALLDGIVDYAGLFPPARLPLHQAIHEYARYCRDPDRWMLGRFVCSAERLGELAPLIPEFFGSESPLQICALGRGGKGASEFLAGLRADLDAITAFLEHHDKCAEVSVYEVRAPAEVIAAGSRGALEQLVNQAAECIEQSRLPRLTPYYEPALGSSWQSTVMMLSKALSEDNRIGARRGRTRYQPAGLKLRCGGLAAADFPSPEQIAFTIMACRDTGVPLKFTAGLHHPFRHFDTSVQTMTHGFVNVFAAGVLAHARQLNEDQVRRVIEDDDSDDFVFDEEALRWRDERASVAEIETARRTALIAFGSCSFEEPRDDLRALGFLT